MRITKTKRGHRPARRLDLAPLREALRSRDVPTALGKVIAPDGGGSHFDVVTDEAGDPTDVLLEVEIVRRRVHVTCRLAQGDGDGGGLWRIPPVGADVAVLIPDGQLDFMPVVVAVLASGSVPARVAGDRTILVARDRVEVIAPDVRLGDGDAGRLVARKDDHVRIPGVGPYVPGLSFQDVLDTRYQLRASPPPLTLTNIDVLEIIEGTSRVKVP